jgi:hypothetical protein
MFSNLIDLFCEGGNWNNWNKEKCWIPTLSDDVRKKTDSLMNLNISKTSIGRFYWCFQLLLPSIEYEEYKISNKINDIDLLNSIINDSVNLWREIEKEDNLDVLLWFNEDIIEIINMKKELLKSNSSIEEWLNALIKVINRRIESVKPK